MEKKALLMFLLILPLNGLCWGFYAHQQINRIAIFSLPPEMFLFFKRHVQIITELSVEPDRRRYVIAEEAPRHYIDLEMYGDSALFWENWVGALDSIVRDTLGKHGIVPWHILKVKFQLTRAFRNHDMARIIRYASDLGHYLADAHVPLHTTVNYNGQLTGQVGVHGLWESRLPELYKMDYDLLVGKSEYLWDLEEKIWQVIVESHLGVDSVLFFEKQVSDLISAESKYSYQERGSSTVRVYSREFCQEYHRLLAGQVELRMRSAIKMISDLWYTCWVDAGQPDLESLLVTGQEQEQSD